MTPQNAENALYEKWRDASPEERPAIERTLLAVVSKHAQKVISLELAEDAPDLVANIAGDAIQQLVRGRFRGECLFSTWTHEIARRKIREELRRRTRQRKVIDDRTTVDALEEKDAEEDDGGYRPRQQIRQPNFDPPILLDQVLSDQMLSPNDRKLARLKLEGLASEEIGVKLRITHEAVDSRWRRLQTRIRKIYPK